MKSFPFGTTPASIIDFSYPLAVAGASDAYITRWVKISWPPDWTTTAQSKSVISFLAVHIT